MILAYVLFSGLAGAMVNQALQFVLLVVCLLPVVFKGLENIGGWNGLTTTLQTVYPLHETSLAHSGATLAMLAGLVLATGYWTTDFRVLQTAMAAKDAHSARRVSLFAAVAMLLIPLPLTLPGIIAVSLPTPHTSTVVREENGAIFHEITVVPREVAAGQGLVPARIDPATGNPLAAADGHPLLDYDRATPNILLHLLPTGLLGLGLAALLACFMSGLAASLTAFIAVAACDLLPSLKTADDRRPILIGRLAAIFFILLAIGVAYALSATNTLGFGFLDALLLGLSLLSASQLATFLLGMFSRRATRARRLCRPCRRHARRYPALRPDFTSRRFLWPLRPPRALRWLACCAPPLPRFYCRVFLDGAACPGHQLHRRLGRKSMHQIQFRCGFEGPGPWLYSCRTLNRIVL